MSWKLRPISRDDVNRLSQEIWDLRQAGNRTRSYDEIIGGYYQMPINAEDLSTEAKILRPNGPHFCVVLPAFYERRTEVVNGETKQYGKLYYTYFEPDRRYFAKHKMEDGKFIGVDPQSWTLTGQWPNVSVTPSIRQYDAWHGYITNGQVQEDCDGWREDPATR